MMFSASTEVEIKSQKFSLKIEYHYDKFMLWKIFNHDKELLAEGNEDNILKELNQLIKDNQATKKAKEYISCIMQDYLLLNKSSPGLVNSYTSTKSSQHSSAEKSNDEVIVNKNKCCTLV